VAWHLGENDTAGSFSPFLRRHHAAVRQRDRRHKNHAIENPAWAIARVEAKIIRQLGERKIDVVLNAPNITKTLIHSIAQDQGVLL